MDVRPATPADADAIARVYARVIVAADHYDDSVDVEAEYRRLHPRVAGYLAGTYHPSYALPERTLLVAADDPGGGEIVGFIAGQRSTRMGCSGELQWTFVLPEWQRRGVGGRLLRPLRTWFAEHDATRVIVDAPPENPCRAFYRKHGAEPLDSYWLYWPDVARGPASPG